MSNQTKKLNNQSSFDKDKVIICNMIVILLALMVIFGSVFYSSSNNKVVSSQIKTAITKKRQFDTPNDQILFKMTRLNSLNLKQLYQLFDLIDTNRQQKWNLYNYYKDQIKQHISVRFNNSYNGPSQKKEKSQQIFYGNISKFTKYGDWGLLFEVDLTPYNLVNRPWVSVYLMGNGNHWRAVGTTSLYNLTHRGFQVYLTAHRSQQKSFDLASEHEWILCYQITSLD